MKKQFLIALTIASSLSACSQIPKEAYFNRGQAESLLDVSSEEISIDLNQRNGLAQLSETVRGGQAGNAQLSCSNRMICERAAEVLDQYNVPYQQVSGPNIVNLSFKSIVARDCDNRFISNHVNPYNLNHPTFGCSTALNHVQMVSDKQQFVDPMLLGNYDGEKAAQNFDTYLSRDPVPLERISASGN